VLIEMQLAIAGLVALAADVMETFQQRPESIEVLQARDVLLADFFPFLSRNALNSDHCRQTAQYHLSGGRGASRIACRTVLDLSRFPAPRPFEP
jgi:hypothetical protein